MSMSQKNNGIEQYRYEELTSRNYGFISDTLQNDIKNTRLALFGCGLSSVIAEALVRIGFQQFILIDADTVELSNLNRQNYYLSDIGKLKVSCLKARLLGINSDIAVECISEEIVSEVQVLKIIKNIDIVINTIDYGKLYFDLIELVRAEDKLVICPFNPCDSGLAVCFNKDSQSIYEFLDTKIPFVGHEFPKRLRELYVPTQLPQKIYDQFQELLPLINEKKYYPQLVLGAHLTTSIVVNYLIKYLEEKNVPVAPNLIYLSV